MPANVYEMSEKYPETLRELWTISGRCSGNIPGISRKYSRDKYSGVVDLGETFARHNSVGTDAHKEKEGHDDIDHGFVVNGPTG